MPSGHYKRPSLRERFDKKWVLDEVTGCHVWTAATNEYGYGVINVSGRMLRAHRVAWELKNGPLAEGQCALHKCDNPPCVNEEHLFSGTHAINTEDKVMKGRQSRGESHRAALEATRVRGVDHGRVKITDARVLEIRTLYATGMYTQQQLADRSGISRENVSKITLRKIWAHL